MLNSRTSQREHKTIAAMIRLYCHDHHQTEKDKLCFSCRELLAYAKTRLDKCPYFKDKPTCAKCPVHCYKPAPRAQIRQVMRYAGPRMMRSHPLMAARHLWKSIKSNIYMKKI